MNTDFRIGPLLCIGHVEDDDWRWVDTQFA
jgi:hypothetical protein